MKEPHIPYVLAGGRPTSQNTVGPVESFAISVRSDGFSQNQKDELLSNAIVSLFVPTKHAGGRRSGFANPPPKPGERRCNQCYKNKPWPSEFIGRRGKPTKANCGACIRGAK